MSTCSRHVRHLSPITILAMVVLLSVAWFPSQSAYATGEQPLVAWHLEISFPNQQLRAIYTAYEYHPTDPINVVFWSQTNLSSLCTRSGNIPIGVDGYAVFNGNSYIQCPLPSKPAGVTSCQAGGFWVASDVKLNNVSATNPILEGVRNGNREFNYSLPTAGNGKARSRLLLGGQYTSPQWNLASAGAANQAMFGSGGQVIGDVVDYAATQGRSWLGFMGNWRSAFDPNATNAELGHLARPGQQYSEQPYAGGFWADPSVVFIGYSPSTSTYLTGAVAHIEIDPPGCRGG